MSEPTTEATPPPPPPPASSRFPFVARILAGAVVVAVVVGIGLVARELTGGDDLTLPDRVGRLYADDSDEALDSIGETDRAQARENALAGYEHNTEQVSRAYDGAEAATRRYGTFKADAQLTVVAVRADSGPPLPLAFDDPVLLKTAAPRNELVEEGDVTCLLTRNTPPIDDGSEPTEEELAPSVVLCQRTGGGLTVRVLGTGEPDLDEVVDATEEVWDHLS